MRLWEFTCLATLLDYSPLDLVPALEGPIPGKYPHLRTALGREVYPTCEVTRLT